MKRSQHKHSLTLRHIGLTRGHNNGFFKLVEALLQSTDSLMLLFTKYNCTWLTAISISLSRCITCQDVCVQQSHATKRLLPLFKVKLCRFVATVLLRNKDQQKNNALATFTTRHCRQRKGHEWTASPSLHDTITANLTLAQCEFHTGKKTVVRFKSINRN